MNKPTKEQILDECITYHKPLDVISFDSIESFTIVMKYKNTAIPLAKAINNKFGQWVYASVHSEWRNPHVSVGYRSVELSKCESCGWLDGMHSAYCKTRRES